MTTLQYNNARTGWNQNEVVLNIGNVNPTQFGRKWVAPLDGEIFSAPLYASGVVIGGQTRNVVYVATERNFIYALDAQTGRSVWPNPYYFLDTAGSESLIPPECGSLGPDIGITSTPVIDLETGTLYAVGLTRQGSTHVFKMAAVDIATGRSRLGWPVTISPPAVPGLNIRFSSNRGALLLANNRIYVPFGAYSGDCGAYHGWVVGVDKANPTAPQVYFRTPGEDTEAGHHGGGIWASGGVAADTAGNIYAVTGNSFHAPTLDYSNAVLRLAPDLSFSRSPRDFFTPSNWQELNRQDADLGSSAPMLLPRQAGSNTPNLIFVAGKWGVGHLVNRDNLGGVAAGDGTHREGVYSARVFDGGVASTAAYYEDPVAGGFIFLSGFDTQPDCGTANGVAALALELDARGNNSYQTRWCTPSMTYAISPVVTSAPGQTGILWVVDGFGGVLHAFNAATGQELYNSSVRPDDALSTTNPFLHFTVIDGQLFIATADKSVFAYGLRSGAVALKDPAPSAGGMASAETKVQPEGADTYTEGRVPSKSTEATTDDQVLPGSDDAPPPPKDPDADREQGLGMLALFWKYWQIMMELLFNRAL